jgi:hypothetical protein
VPGAGNPQSLNRYTYVNNNPLAYTDPSGHWPSWGHAFRGFVVQYVNDVTFGFGGAVYQAINGLSIDQDPSEGFQEGRQYGRALSTAQSVANVVAGSGLAAAGASAGPLTAAIALLGAGPSGGGTVVAGAVVITAEGAMVVIGLSEAAYGLAMLAYIKGDPLQGTNDDQPNPHDLRKLTRKEVRRYDLEAAKDADGVHPSTDLYVDVNTGQIWYRAEQEAPWQWLDTVPDLMK